MREQLNVSLETRMLCDFRQMLSSLDFIHLLC